MESNQLNSPKLKGQYKGKGYRSQKETIFHYLQENIASASMVSEATGVPQKNICRIKRDLEKEGRLWELEKKFCKQTGFRSWYLTTNPDKAPNQIQYKLFDD